MPATGVSDMLCQWRAKKGKITSTKMWGKIPKGSLDLQICRYSQISGQGREWALGHNNSSNGNSETLARIMGQVSSKHAQQWTHWILTI